MPYPSGGPPFSSPVDTDTGTLGNWRGVWEQQEYRVGDQVVDNGWLMTANTTTNDKAAPQPIGDPINLYSGTMTNTNEVASQLLFGQRYTAQRDYWISGVRVFTRVGKRYSVYLVRDPLGAAVSEQLATFVSGVDGWRDFGIQPEVIRVGDVYDLFVQTAASDTSTTIFSGDWSYTTPPQLSVPTSGVISHANVDRSIVAVHKIDDSGADRSTELAGLGFGDVIRGAGQEWAIQSAVDQGTYYDFKVLPESQGAPDGVGLFEFESLDPASIDFGQDADYWLSRPELVVDGFKLTDGQYPPATLDSNAYGVDLVAQLADVSPGWDFQSFTTTKTSDISGDGLVFINALFGVTGTGVVTTGDATWTEIGRVPLVENSDVTMTMYVTSKRTDDYGAFSAVYEGLLSDDGGTANLVQNIETQLHKTTQNGLNFRVVEDADEFVLEVRGRNSQDWSWRLAYAGRVRT